MYILEDIALEQLTILGIAEEYQAMIAITAVFFIIYLCIKPLILYLHYQHYTIVTTFLMNSLIVFGLLSIFASLKKDAGIYHVGFQTMAVCGIIMVLYVWIKQIINIYKA